MKHIISKPFTRWQGASGTAAGAEALDDDLLPGPMSSFGKVVTRPTILTWRWAVCRR